MPRNCQVKNYQVRIMSTFGEFLRKQRESKGLTQDKFAKSLDIPSTDVSKIERGKKKFTFSKLEELADFFGVDFKETRDMYAADILVQQARKYQCSDKVFAVAEAQAKYLRNKNAKQTKMDL